MKQEFGYFLKNAKFRAALGLTLLLSYGYAIATTRVSIDSLEGDRYIGTGGVMLSTGRFGMNLWAAVLGYGRAEPSYAFGIDLLAALLLALAAVSFCALLRKAAQDRISMFGYGLFACLFVSYPLMNEIWEYSGANVCVCGGYLLDAAALNLLWDARQPGVPWRGRALRMCAAALCLMVVCSSYESLAAVFVLAVFALLTLEQLLAAERPRLAAVLTEGLWYAAALVGGLCLRVLVTSGIHLVLPQAAANGATEILWAFYPFVYLAKLLVKGILINYALRGCFYLPIAELAVAVPVFVVLVIVLAVRKKRPLLLLTGAGTLLSLVLLSFVQGRYSPYRTCQVFALFVALAGLAVYELLRRAAARRAVLLGSVQLLAVLLCLHQAMYLNHLLAVDYQRSEQEAAVVRTLGTELVRDYGTDKPVVLVGRYTLGENITRYTTADPMQHPLYRFFREHTSWESGDTVKYVETNCNSVLLRGGRRLRPGSGAPVPLLWLCFGHDPQRCPA